MFSSSARVNTFPVGFWGVLRRRSRVLGEKAAENSSQSRCQEEEVEVEEEEEEEKEGEEEGGKREKEKKEEEECFKQQ